MDKNKAHTDSNRSRNEFLAPIPLLIHPADVKKEFDKHKAVTPGPFQVKSEPSTSNGHAGHSREAVSSTSTESVGGKKKKKGGLQKSPSNESLCSSSKGPKKRRLESLSRSPARSMGSREEGREMLAWIMDPVSLTDFFAQTWEKRPLHIGRAIPNYYSALLSSEGLDQILKEHKVEFTKNLDITSYRNGKRETLNPEGRATPGLVWDMYRKGCSVRLLNPQTFSDRVWVLNSMMQEYLNCFVGANVYLTPAGTQGFAPHYDDIEAFVLQLEGKKHWRLYSPRCEEDELPRFSSGNLQEDDIGEPIMDVIMEAGDLLYFPRGTIHQANALPECHSLHITVSCYQKNSWGDFLEKLLPAALETAMEEDVEFRRGLPRDFLEHVGVAHSDQVSAKRAFFLEKLRVLTDKLFRYAPVDAAADQMGKQLVHDALPPMLAEDEAARTSVRNGVRMEGGQVSGIETLSLKTKVRLLRANLLRLVSEDDMVKVYHSLDNPREYHAEEPRSFEVNPEEATAVEVLIHQYPDYLVVANLPFDQPSDKLQLANMLWKKGLLMTSKVLEAKK